VRSLNCSFRNKQLATVVSEEGNIVNHLYCMQIAIFIGVLNILRPSVKFSSLSTFISIYLRNEHADTTSIVNYMFQAFNTDSYSKHTLNFANKVKISVFAIVFVSDPTF
jgi:hypothetical protein